MSPLSRRQQEVDLNLCRSLLLPTQKDLNLSVYETNKVVKWRKNM